MEINQESVNLVGCIHPEYYDYFRRNLSELTEGEFPSTSNRGAIISETLAEENNLHVGDFIEIKPYQTGVEISDDAVKEDIIFGDQIISIKITGIFGTKLYFNVAETNQNGSAIFRISPYNTIFVDYNTAVSITESTPDSILCRLKDVWTGHRRIMLIMHPYGAAWTCGMAIRRWWCR